MIVFPKALAENAIGENAQHPYDIVKSYKGLTVHIDNTDAEGATPDFHGIHVV